MNVLRFTAPVREIGPTTLLLAEIARDAYSIIAKHSRGSGEVCEAPVIVWQQVMRVAHDLLRRTPRETFHEAKVVVDATTNSPELVAQRKLGIKVFVKLYRAAEYHYGFYYLYSPTRGIIEVERVPA